MKTIILNNTKSLIRKKGINFTISDIAKENRISKNTFYQYFKSKEDVIYHIIEELKIESDDMQIKLLEDSNITTFDKLKKILVVLPTDFDLINPITLNQLETTYPELFQFMLDIYHQDWDRFTKLYKECEERGIVEPLDIEFFRELYIVGITHLPTSPGMNKYNHKELLEKLVEQLFNGVRRLK